MHEAVTTVLDVAALLGVAVGVYFVASPFIGGAAMVPAGLTVGSVSAFWAWRTRARDGARDGARR